MGRVIAWAVLVLTSVWLMTAGGTYPGIAFVPAQIATQVLAVLVLGGWLLLCISRPEWRPATPLLRPVLLVALAYAASGLFSQRPRLSLEPTLAGLSFALAFVFLPRLLADSWFRRRAGSLLILATVLIASAYIIQVGALWVEWWMLVGRVTVPPLRPAFAGLLFGSPNLVATALLILGPLAVTLVRLRTHRVAPAVTLSMLVVIAVVLTGSRGAYLGAAIGVLVAAAIALGTPERRVSAVAVAKRLRRRPESLLAVGAVGVAAVAVAPAIFRRFAQGGDSLRLDLWMSAMTIFAEHPVTGGGPGTWVQLKIEANPPGAANVVLQHAHSLYFQTLAEVGLLGAVALVVLVVAVLKMLLHMNTTRGGPAAESAAVLVGLACFAGQSIVDNLVNLPAVVLLLLVVVAWADSARITAGTPRVVARSTQGSLGRVPAVSGLVGVAIAVSVLVPIDLAGLRSAAGNEAALSRDWTSALARYEEALAADPNHTLYQLERAGMLARVGRLPEARSELAAAAAVDPVGSNVTALAMLDLALGDPAAAVAGVRRGVELAPGDQTLLLNAGVVGQATGDRTLAVEAFAAAIATNPALARTRAQERIDPALFGEAIELAATRSEPVTAALIRAYAGESRRAIATLSAMPSSEPRDTALAAAMALSGDAAQAISLLRTRLGNEPQSWTTAGWLARISRQTGDPAAAAKYARWAMIVQADAAEGAVNEQSVSPAEPVDPTAGLPANYPWSVYLRPVPPFLYPPQLVTVSAR